MTKEAFHYYCSKETRALFSRAACCFLIFDYFLSRKSNENNALHENHRLHFAACCVPISAIANAKAGDAITHASWLNLGKFRGSRACDLD
jgi:hypothetical protein